MQFRNHTRRQAASLLGALAAATALASPALAMRPDDRAGIRGVDAAAPAAAAQPDALMRYAVGHGLTSHQPYQYSWGAGDARLVSSKSYTQIRQTDPRAAGPVAGLRPDNRAADISDTYRPAMAQSISTIGKDVVVEPLRRHQLVVGLQREGLIGAV